MQTFFYVCFGVGAGYAVLSFLLGEALGLMHFDTHFDTHVDTDGFLPFKPAVIAAFLTVFGGIGIILVNKISIILTISIAGILGFIIASLLYRFVIVPLYKAQNTSAIEIQSLVGHTAKVTIYIPQGQYGKITYYAEGNTYTAPAKSEDGNEIKTNEIVEITHIEKSTYYVRKK